MKAITRIGGISAIVVTALSLTAGTAFAAPQPAAPRPGNISAHIRPDPRDVDAVSDYNNAVQSAANQELAAGVTGAVVGGVVGLPVGCLVGAVGLVAGPLAVVTVPVGCIVGLAAGAAIGAGVGSLPVGAALNPGLQQRCPQVKSQFDCWQQWNPYAR